MKKSLLLILSLLLTLALAACSGGSQKSNGNNAAGNTLYDQIKAKGVVTIGTEGTYAPFSFHDQNGQLTGFDIDIAKEVFKRLNIKPQFIETKWDGMIAGLDAKRYDLVANEVSITPDRQQKYDFSDPYIVSKAVLVVGANNNTIHSYNDLNGKKVAESLTSNFNALAKQHGAVITPVDGFNQAVDLLTSGRIDGTINDSLSYLDLKKQRPDLPIKVAYTEPDATQNAFLFRKGNPDFVKAVNQALADMKKDGTYLKISKKWFGEDVSK